MSQQAQSGVTWAWRMKRRPFARRWPLELALTFTIVFLVTLAIAMLQVEEPFYTDAGGYWQLGTTFTVNGHFSLLNFHDEVKGYFFPLITHVLQALAGDWAWTPSSIVKVYSALLFTLIGTVLGPAFIKIVWPSQPRWGSGRRVALMALIIVFWSGFLNVPLSDFTALAMALLTLIAVSRVDSPGWMFLAGAALAATLNIRESYLVLVPAVLLLIPWAWIEQRGKPHPSRPHRALCVGAFVIAFALISLPQSLSAHRYHGTWSFVPGASVTEPAGEYYSPGIGVQSYDTFITEGLANTEGKYGFPAGERLLEELPGGKVTSNSQYIGLYEHHPLVMFDMLVRHVVNGMDPLYSTAYVEHLHNYGRTWGRIAGFLLVFIALLRVFWPAARRRLGPGRLRFLPVLAVSVLTTIPNVMERRYLLPVYLLVYMLALTPSWPNPIGQSGTLVRRLRTPAIILTVFAVYAAFVWYITSNAIEHLHLVVR
jgi:hypothetical protein